jgi:hypothetical protein
VTRRLSHLLIALALVAALLPAAALASSAGKPKKHHGSSGCAGSTSAECVYVDTLPGADGSHPVGTRGKTQPVPSRVSRRLARYGGKDRTLLTQLAGSALPHQFGHAHGGGIAVSSPGTLLAALDLGAGPIALFATLLAGAVAFAVGRVLRRRRAG